MTDDVTAGYRRMRAGEPYETPDFHILGLQIAARKKLEAILHPPIHDLWRAQVQTWEAEGRSLAVVVIPLLYYSYVRRYPPAKLT